MSLFASTACRAICCILVLALVALIIAASVIASTFRMPDVNVTGVVPADDSITKAITQRQFAWKVFVSVNNNWNQDIYLSHLDFSVVPATMPDVLPTKGSKSDVNLPGNQKTDFEILLTTPLEGDGVKQGTSLVELYRSCAGGKFEIKYTATIWFKVFGLGPFKLPKEITGSAAPPCPGLKDLFGGLLGN